jgi:hypothetical protein
MFSSSTTVHVPVPGVGVGVGVDVVGVGFFEGPPPVEPLEQDAKVNPITAIIAIAIITAALRAAWSFAVAKLMPFVFIFFIKTPFKSKLSLPKGRYLRFIPYGTVRYIRLLTLIVF